MKFILMDLDGTITNPKGGITKSVQYALKEMGIIVEDLDSLTKHIGPPIKEGFMEYYGFSQEEADKAVKKYREYYIEHGIFDNEPYEGIDLLLQRWVEEGRQMIVATSKPEPLARRILEYYKLDQYFTDICGATFDEQRSQKQEVISYALEKNRITELSEVIMVGDRKYDVLGAKAIGIPCIGVLYGFGSEEELHAAGVAKIVATIEELYQVVSKL